MPTKERLVSTEEPVGVRAKCSTRFFKLFQLRLCPKLYGMATIEVLVVPLESGGTMLGVAYGFSSYSSEFKLEG